MAKTFLEINYVRNGETLKEFVKVADIMGIKEFAQETQKLYNECGELVSETKPTEKLFQVLIVTERGNKDMIMVNETEYERLKTELNS